LPRRGGAGYRTRLPGDLRRDQVCREPDEQYGGPGGLIFEGLAGSNVTKMLSGAVPAILIALAVDRALSVMERRLEKKK